MSDTIKDFCDDMDEWREFKAKVGISKALWHAYSLEASLAKEGYEKHKLKGVSLVDWVQLQVEAFNVVNRYKNISDRYNLYLELKKEFDNV
jgi:hypothetical protein